MSSEQSFAYDGPLSTYREWDSLVYGVAIGCLLSIPRVRRDIRKEPSKAIGGALLTIIIAEAKRA